MAKQISPEIQQKIQDFQEAQQQARIVLNQKYSVELQLKELQNALNEMEKTDKPEVYKALGQILLRSNREKIITELKESIEALNLRLKSLEKHEKKLAEKISESQETLQKTFSGIESGAGG